MHTQLLLVEDILVDRGGEEECVTFLWCLPSEMADSFSSKGLQIQTIKRADAGSLRGFRHIGLSSPTEGLQLGCFLTNSCSFEAAGRTEHFFCGAPCALGALHVENINPVQTPFLYFLPTPT